MINAVNINVRLFLLTHIVVIVATSLPAVKPAAVKYINVRFTLYQPFRTRNEGPRKKLRRPRNSIKTGDLASVRRVTFVCRADIYFVLVWANPLFFYSLYPKYGPLVPPADPNSGSQNGVSICVTSRNFRAVEQLHKSFVRLSRSHGE